MAFRTIRNQHNSSNARVVSEGIVSAKLHVFSISRISCITMGKIGGFKSEAKLHCKSLQIQVHTYTRMGY